MGKPRIKLRKLIWIYGLGIGLTGLAAQAEVRTWTSTVGTTIEAEMVRYNEQSMKVTLKTEEGRVLEVDILQLTMPDRNYVHQKQEIAASGKQPSTPPASDSSSKNKPLFGDKPTSSSTSKKTDLDLPPGVENLVDNGDFERRTSGWTTDGDIVADPTNPDNQVLRFKLDPNRKQTLKVKRPASVPRNAVQFGARLRAMKSQDFQGSSNPLRLEIWNKADTKGSTLNRKIYGSGSWSTVKWTRSSDIPDSGGILFTIVINPGSGTIWIDDIYVFAHPDYKDKKSWNPTDG